MRRLCFSEIAENYKLPYYTLSPTYSICKDHGYLRGEVPTCPECGAETEIYSRITGYYRPLQNWNDGKRQEFADRKTYSGGVSADKEQRRNRENRCKSVGAVYALYTAAACPQCKDKASAGGVRNSFRTSRCGAIQRGSLIARTATGSVTGGIHGKRRYGDLRRICANQSVYLRKGIIVMDQKSNTMSPGKSLPRTTPENVGLSSSRVCEFLLRCFERGMRGFYALRKGYVFAKRTRFRLKPRTKSRYTP